LTKYQQGRTFIQEDAEFLEVGAKDGEDYGGPPHQGKLTPTRNVPARMSCGWEIGANGRRKHSPEKPTYCLRKEVLVGGFFLANKLATIYDGGHGIQQQCGATTAQPAAPPR
jgi:hypothetical protein